MSVLIKGMEMPECTTKAMFGVDADGNHLCMVFTNDDTKNPDIFDIIEIKTPHGRLIDKDALDIYTQEEIAQQEYASSDGMEYFEGLKDGWHEAAKQLSIAPTVIEAEGGKQ